MFSIVGIIVIEDDALVVRDNVEGDMLVVDNVVVVVVFGVEVDVENNSFVSVVVDDDVLTVVNNIVVDDVVVDEEMVHSPGPVHSP